MYFMAFGGRWLFGWETARQKGNRSIYYNSEFTIHPVQRVHHYAFAFGTFKISACLILAGFLVLFCWRFFFCCLFFLLFCSPSNWRLHFECFGKIPLNQANYQRVAMLFSWFLFLALFLGFVLFYLISVFGYLVFRVGKTKMACCTMGMKMEMREKR